MIITPHNEAIRTEFGRGFQSWYRAKTGRTVAPDWRVVGGTSDITRFLEAEYIAAFKNYWTGQLQRPWSAAVVRSAPTTCSLRRTRWRRAWCS